LRHRSSRKASRGPGSASSRSTATQETWPREPTAVPGRPPVARRPRRWSATSSRPGRRGVERTSLESLFPMSGMIFPEIPRPRWRGKALWRRGIGVACSGWASGATLSPYIYTPMLGRSARIPTRRICTWCTKYGEWPPCKGPEALAKALLRQKAFLRLWPGLLASSVGRRPWEQSSNDMAWGPFRVRFLRGLQRWGPLPES
jgi:hypothetical protein